MTLRLDTCANMNLRKAARLTGQFYDQSFNESGLRATQFTLIAALKNLAPISKTEFADEMGMDRTTLTRNLRLLEKDGLIEAVEGKDARVRMLTLTPKGIETVDKVRPYWEETQKEFLCRFGTERWGKLMIELEALSDVLSESKG